MDTISWFFRIRKNFALIIFIFFGVFFLSVFPAISKGAVDYEAAKAFTKKCSSCHTIGGGVLKGPDLKGVTERRDTEWLVKFIKSSDAMIQSGDPVAVKLYNEFKQIDMPDAKLSEKVIRKVIQFIASGEKPVTPLQVKSALEATEADILAGQQLYLGAVKLSKGGIACVHCHSVSSHGPLGGGTLGKNLTHTYSDFKDKGLSLALKNLAFPVMSEVFEDHPLTDKEIFQIKAFLYDADKKGISTRDFQKKFLFLGLGGTVLAMGLIDFSWRRRRKQSVRKSRGGIR